MDISKIAVVSVRTVNVKRQTVKNGQLAIGAWEVDLGLRSWLACRDSYTIPFHSIPSEFQLAKLEENGEGC